MTCIAQCHKCGTIHILGAECPKPRNPDEIHEWTNQTLKNIREHEERSKNVNMKFGGKEMTEKEKIARELQQIIIDKELTPDVCEDSGQAEWSSGEAMKLAMALAHEVQRMIIEEIEKLPTGPFDSTPYRDERIAELKEGLNEKV